MAPRASLKTFLGAARAALTTHSSKRTAPLTFVVGNESADLDSLCSALLLAYFHTYAPPKKSISKEDTNPALHIPICHLERADLSLRPEFAAVLRDAGVASEDVFTLEDVLPSQDNTAKTEKAALRPEDTRWLLVDHNAMTGRLAAAFASRVVGCVDHHADENVVPRHAEPRLIEKSGSCASLVLGLCADSWAALSGAESGENKSRNSDSDTRTQKGKETEKGREINDEKEIREEDARIARLALAPILIDTTNLRDENKTTEHDERAVALAEAKIQAAEEGYTNSAGSGESYDVNGINSAKQKKKYNRDDFFAHLSALKEDVAEMSFRDVLRKDYKAWSVDNLNLATSSAPRGFGYLLQEKAQGDPAVFVSALREWAGEKDAGDDGRIDLVVVLAGFKDEEGRFCRELLVWARTEAGVRAAELFEERQRNMLRLEAWGGGALDCNGDGDGDDGWRRCWTQKAVEYGRKQIAPMLRDALAEVAKRR
ncbi:exopolyphosphatase-like protein [Xylaria arbuscula]|nr:exopolyphosphatase-like protein [Xylaria arbuscula]